jgi:hypothetical protein
MGEHIKYDVFESIKNKFRLRKETDPVLKGLASYQSDIATIQRCSILAPQALAKHYIRNPETSYIALLINLQDAVVQEYLRLDQLCNRYYKASEEQKKKVMSEIEMSIPDRYIIR